MKNKGLVLGIFVLIIGAAMVGLSFGLPLQTDSGWDTDYSSGSDWSSSDSWSSSDYDWDYSSGSSSHSSYSSSGFDDFITICFIITFLVFIFTTVIDSHSKQKQREKRRNELRENSTNNIEKSDDGISIEEKMKLYLPTYTEESVKDELYKIFVDVQKAWMDFDYDKLRSLCTDQLYESYKSDLEVLKQKNGKNIMSDFKLKSSRLINIENENNQITVTINMYISFYDYVIDVNTDEVIRGKKHVIVSNNYVLKYIIKKDSSIVDACPNCGAKLTGSDCSFCNTHIENNGYSFVLSEKKKI